MRTDYGQNKDPKILGGKGNKATSGYMMEYGILCCNTGDDIRFIK